MSDWRPYWYVARVLHDWDVSLFCAKDVLLPTLMLETRVGSAWRKNAAALAPLFHHAPGLAGGDLAPATFQMYLLPSACGILALQDYVWWELTPCPLTLTPDPPPHRGSQTGDELRLLR